jgi:hypothetical protein
MTLFFGCPKLNYLCPLGQLHQRLILGHEQEGDSAKKAGGNSSNERTGAA